MGWQGSASRLTNSKPSWSEEGSKRFAPATARNREHIAQVLAAELPDEGTVLEIAAGSGEHAVHFSGCFPRLAWLPTDPDEESLASIAAWRAETARENLLGPRQLDTTDDKWPCETASAIVCINMIHIAPWQAAIGLFDGANKVLQPEASVILYGPFFEAGIDPAPSNVSFDLSLKSRNPQWGIRQAHAVDELAEQSGFERAARYEMPANNLVLVYRKR